jgi:hypothetical protein
MFQINKKERKARIFQNGRDQVSIYLIAKIDLQTINVQMDYFRYHLFMNFKMGNKKHISHTVYHIHTLCLIIILTKMLQKIKLKGRLFVIP